MIYRTKKKFESNLDDKYCYLILFKYDNKYYPMSDEVLERLEDAGYKNSVNILNNCDSVSIDDGQLIEMAIDDIFTVYPRDERLEDNFQNISVFIVNKDTDDIAKVLLLARRGRRSPVYVAYDRGAIRGRLDSSASAVAEARKISKKTEKVKTAKKSIQKESVKTDYDGGFTDLLKQVDALLERYFQDYQVETIVTDNGYATITVFSKNDDTTITVDLSYSDGKAKLVSDDKKAVTVDVNVDKNEYEDLSDAIIKIVEKTFKKSENLSRKDKIKKLEAFIRTQRC